MTWRCLRSRSLHFVIIGACWNLKEMIRYGKRHNSVWGRLFGEDKPHAGAVPLMQRGHRPVNVLLGE